VKARFIGEIETPTVIGMNGGAGMAAPVIAPPPALSSALAKGDDCCIVRGLRNSLPEHPALQRQGGWAEFQQAGTAETA
jgi:hypothetical protein